MLGHKEILFNFLRNRETFSTATVPFYISTSCAPGFQFLLILTNMLFSNFLRLAICGCEEITHSDFDMRFPND